MLQAKNPTLDEQSLEPSANEFLSHLTREVRTSLSSVLGFVETLYDSNQSTKERFLCLRKIKFIIENTAKGLEDLEHLTSYEKGWLSVRSAQFGLEEELSDTLLTLQSLARKSELAFQVQVDGQIPSIVLSDPLRLRQIVNHLVHLFLQHITRGSIRLTLGVSDPPHSKLTFSMDSTGENLSSDLFNEVIHPNRNRSALAVPIARGRSAMDLSLIHVLATTLGGSCQTFKSRFGKGCGLTVFIDPGPIDTSTPTLSSFNLKSIENSSAVKSITIPNFSQKHFLVVEDDKDISDVLVHFLKRTGATVSQASDGEEGLRLAIKGKFDIVFLDLQLPKLSGLEVCKQIRNTANPVPVIALTANTSVAIKTKCREAGFSLYLTKPVSIETLFDIIPKVLI